MVEGGENLYNELKDFVDWKVFIISPKINKLENFKSQDNLEVLYSEKRDDLILWGK